MSVRLFVGNLPYDATEQELHAHFAPTGAPMRIAIPLDRTTGRPRGFAFVDFADAEIAKAIIREFDSRPFKTRPLAVREARPREERPPGARPPHARAPGGPPATGARGGFDGSRSGAREEGPRRMRAAPPRHKKSERGGPKGPIPIRTTGRFFSDEDDDTTDVDVDFDNFATRAPEADLPDDAEAEGVEAEGEREGGDDGATGSNDRS